MLGELLCKQSIAKQKKSTAILVILSQASKNVSFSFSNRDDGINERMRKQAECMDTGENLSS